MITEELALTIHHVRGVRSHGRRHQTTIVLATRVSGPAPSPSLDSAPRVSRFVGVVHSHHRVRIA